LLETEDEKLIAKSALELMEGLIDSDYTQHFLTLDKSKRAPLAHIINIAEKLGLYLYCRKNG
jgi:hypothetical protein